MYPENSSTRVTAAKPTTSSLNFHEEPTGKLGYAFISLCALIGGAGNYYPLIELALQMNALAIIALCITQIRVNDITIHQKRIFAVIAATIGLFLLQLLPLPLTALNELPYRGLSLTILREIGSTGLHPASLTWDATLQDFFFLTVPIAGFFLAICSDNLFKLNSIRIFIGVAILSVLLSTFQVMSPRGSGNFHIFETAHDVFATGLFVNRNHQAVYLNICIVMCAIPGIFDKSAQQFGNARSNTFFALGVIAALTLGVIATLSRAGVFLLPISIISCALLLLKTSRSQKYTGLILLSILIMTSTILASYWSTQISDRFVSVEDSKRFDTWRDTYYAVTQTFPIGSGIGSFKTVYTAFETLESVDRFISNHAHNEILQIALEGGVAAIVILFVLLLILALGAKHSLEITKNSTPARILILAALIGIIELIAHSVVDYPLRMASLCAFFGFLIGLIFPSKDRRRNFSIRKRQHLALSITFLIVSIPMVLINISSSALLNGNAAAATRIWPYNSQAWARLSDEQVAAGNHAAAVEAARRSLRIAPLQAAPLRNLAVVAAKSNNDKKAHKLISLAGSLGWRDTASQLLIAQDAMASGNREDFVNRVDALLRRGIKQDDLNRLLASTLIDDKANSLIAEHLAKNPDWRKPFLLSLSTYATSNISMITKLAQNMRDLRSPLSTTEATPIITAMVSESNYQGAVQLWRSIGEQFPGDGGFEHSEGKVLPSNDAFRWRSKVLFGTTVNVVASPDENSGNAVNISSNGIAEGIALEQVLGLTSGRHTLTLSASEQRGSLTDLFVTVTCISSERHPEIDKQNIRWSDQQGIWRRGTLTFSIPENTCPGQLLAIGLRPDNSGPGNFLLDDIRIKPQ